jgi:hypothetical protein
MHRVSIIANRLGIPQIQIRRKLLLVHMPVSPPLFVAAFYCAPPEVRRSAASCATPSGSSPQELFCTEKTAMRPREPDWPRRMAILTLLFSFCATKTTPTPDPLC